MCPPTDHLTRLSSSFRLIYSVCSVDSFFVRDDASVSLCENWQVWPAKHRPPRRSSIDTRACAALWGPALRRSRRRPHALATTRGRPGGLCAASGWRRLRLASERMPVFVAALALRRALCTTLPAYMIDGDPGAEAWPSTLACAGRWGYPRARRCSCGLPARAAASRPTSEERSAASLCSSQSTSRLLKLERGSRTPGRQHVL